MRQQTEYWTNPSVLKFAGKSDPIDFITEILKDPSKFYMSDGKPN